MTVSIIISSAIIIMMISVCSADLNFLSFITKIYDSNVKSFWNAVNVNKHQPDRSVFVYDNQVNNANEIDDNYWTYYLNEDHYQAYQYGDSDDNYITHSNENVFTSLKSYEAEEIIEQQRSRDGILSTILKFFGYQTPTTVPFQNLISPIKTSNKTSGLDVRLKSSYFTKMLMETMESRFKLIYPGTLWCGGGTLARKDNDYGLFRKTDKCCRKHDSCPKYIAAGETWKNLENIGIFTRSHCDCERSFYTCLKRINSFISNKIGVTYFNLLRPQCFRKEYPIVSCLEKRKDNRCFNYVIDNSKTKQWQWFDNKVY